MNCCFFFNDTATTEIHTDGHTLSLHDGLPISLPADRGPARLAGSVAGPARVRLFLAGNRLGQTAQPGWLRGSLRSMGHSFSVTLRHGQCRPGVHPRPVSFSRPVYLPSVCFYSLSHYSFPPCFVLAYVSDVVPLC